MSKTKEKDQENVDVKDEKDNKEEFLSFSNYVSLYADDVDEKFPEEETDDETDKDKEEETDKEETDKKDDE